LELPPGSPAGADSAADAIPKEAAVVKLSNPFI